MYLDFFSFKEHPFTLTPNPEFLFLSRCHQEGYAHLLYGIESKAGFVELTGEVGTGKTTLVRTLLTGLAADKFRSALIFNPTLSPVTLLQEISRELGLPFQSADTRELHQLLNEYLLRESAEGRTVVLVIDEAQNLSRDALEQVRLISNLETEREKLIQIVLVGQPELRDLLGREDLRQLRQRITVNYHLERMEDGDIHEYIRHRIRVAAGGRESVQFSKGAVKIISRFSGGLPRQINTVCDRVLLLAYSRDLREVTAKMAREAAADLARHGKGDGRPLKVWAALLIALFVVVASYFFVSRKESLPLSPPLAAIQTKTDVGVGGVKALQEMLRAAGFYQGGVTGVFDSVTETAVRSFQKSEGLKVDGAPGGQTLARLYQKVGGVFVRSSSSVIRPDGGGK